MSERPPGDRDRELTEGDPLEAGGEPAPPPPPPWRRDPPAQDPAPAKESWRPYAEDEPEPSPAQESWQPYAEDEHAAEEDSDDAEAQRAFGAEPPPSLESAFGMPQPERPEPAPDPAPPIPDPAPPAPDPFPPEPDPVPTAPRTGSIGPPGYESGALGGVPPGATLPPQQFQSPAPAERYVLAEWWRRAVAYLLDGLIIGVVVTLLIVIITGAAGGVGFLGGDVTGYGGLLLGLLFSTLLATAVAVLYAPFYMARTNGQTLGKQVMGIRVVRPGGRPVDFLWSVLREVIIKAFLFAGLGSSITFGLAWLVDCLWPLWDNENRALHDLIVDSRVVRV